MKRDYACPGCGEPGVAVAEATEFTCPHCGESLVSSGSKVVLAKPLQAYLETDDREEDSPSQNGTSDVTAKVLPLSPRRRKKAAELAYQRIEEHRRYGLKGFYYGLSFVIFGGLLLLVALVRLLLVADDWMSYASLASGLVFIPLGAYITIWFSVSIRSWNKDEKELEREIQELKESK